MPRRLGRTIDHSSIVKDVAIEIIMSEFEFKEPFPTPNYDKYKNHILVKKSIIIHNLEKIIQAINSDKLEELHIFTNILELIGEERNCFIQYELIRLAVFKNSQKCLNYFLHKNWCLSLKFCNEDSFALFGNSRIFKQLATPLLIAIFNDNMAITRLLLKHLDAYSFELHYLEFITDKYKSFKESIIDAEEIFETDLIRNLVFKTAIFDKCLLENNFTDFNIKNDFLPFAEFFIDRLRIKLVKNFEIHSDNLSDAELQKIFLNIVVAQIKSDKSIEEFKFTNQLVEAIAKVFVIAEQLKKTLLNNQEILIEVKGVQSFLSDFFQLILQQLEEESIFLFELVHNEKDTLSFITKFTLDNFSVSEILYLPENFIAFLAKKLREYYSAESKISYSQIEELQSLIADVSDDLDHATGDNKVRLEKHLRSLHANLKSLCDLAASDKKGAGLYLESLTDDKQVSASKNKSLTLDDDSSEFGASEISSTAGFKNTAFSVKSLVGHDLLASEMLAVSAEGDVTMSPVKDPTAAIDPSSESGIPDVELLKTALLGMAS